MVKLFTYADGSFRVVHNINDYSSKVPVDFENKDEIITDYEELQRISISRSKRVIREYVLCNNFTYFVTLTVSSSFCDRDNIDDCEKKLRELLKKYKRKNKNFIYLLIAEKHKNGGFHFHGFFGGVNTQDLKLFTLDMKLPYKILSSLNKGNSVYFMPLFQDNLGYCTLSPIRSQRKSANYCLKYITKDCCRNSNGSLYICSRGLSRASSQYINSFNINEFIKIAFKHNSFYNYYKNNFVYTLDFHPDDLPNCLKYNFENFINDNSNVDFFVFLERFKRLQKNKNKKILNF